MNRRIWCSAGGVARAAAVALLAAAGEASAQGSGVSLDVEIIPANRLKGTETYAAKFICGEGQGPFFQALVPGIYRTAINIQNPGASSVSFTKRAVVTNAQDEDRGAVGNPVNESLGPNQGLEVDCDDIADLLDVDITFEKGFVVISSRSVLNVVGVYTVLVVGEEPT